MSDRHTNELSSRKNSLSKIVNQLWHLPDNFHWMAPLPLPHRRWLVLLFIIVTILLLWPAPKRNIAEPIDRNIPLQAALIIDGYQPFESTPPQPVQFIGNKIQMEDDEQGSWQPLQVQQGQSLIQIFRANNLPVEDALALAKVEGNDRPLSNLKAGQSIKVKRDEKGKIVAIDVELPDGKQAVFFRQSSGEFFRY